MRRFRLLLTLLLCLTVPAATWASVFNGALCAPTQEHHTSAVDHDDDADASSAGALIHHHDAHCLGAHDHGHPCKGDACDCGCGMGLCSAASHALVGNGLSSVLLAGGAQPIPKTQVSGYTDFAGGSPLRPPIA